MITNKFTMKEYLKKVFASTHDSMMKNRKNEKLYNQYYGERQATARIIIDLEVMTSTELQEYLDELNKNYEFYF